jgi:hypothetical protein
MGHHIASKRLSRRNERQAATNSFAIARRENGTMRRRTARYSLIEARLVKHPWYC